MSMVSSLAQSPKPLRFASHLWYRDRARMGTLAATERITL
ncbi:hypothetical protein HMPREF0970_00834 [Schaalia odontolytica F0309]|uniref:Uncharacterized protein n=1 Tax=Schaalia odontolytica F0309 TaxID=649742 RepID=D4TY12_9ACTO|nr:hypothetical protein HMPREF0970_00834 [Schaalia odontolytica F0309]